MGVYMKIAPSLLGELMYGKSGESNAMEITKWY